MHVRVFIPLLAAVSINAVEIVPGSGLSLSGYGGAFALFDDREINNPRNTSSAPRADQTVGDFPSELALNLMYTVDQFTLRADTIIADHAQFDDNNVLLEQAFIDWRVNDYLTLRAGRFQNTWLGWEGFRAPELFRVRHSAAWDWNVENHGLGEPRPFVTDGAGFKLATRDRQFISEFYVADDLFGDGPTSDGADKAVGGCFTWKPEGLGHVELGFGYDPNSVNNGTTTSSSDCYGADINMHLTKWLDQGWFFAAECQVHRHPELTVAGTRYGSDLIALAMVNYAITPGKMSVTAMVDYVERGFAADDNEIWEYAVALLTKPHRQVRFNLETYYWAETGERADSYGAGAVLLVALP